MHNMLPFSFPPTETYQGLSFVLGCVLGNENSRDAYYNKYINLECVKTNNIFELEIYFAQCMWENYWKDNIAELDLYAIKNISKEYFVSFLRERIDQNNYILLFKVDEYYLSYSANYKQNHYAHDTYIVGYDDDSFYVMAYKQKKFQLIKVSNREIIDSLYLAEIGIEIDFCTFRIHPHIYLKMDVEKVCTEYEKYLLGEGYGEQREECMIFGINVYDELLKAINAFIEDPMRTIIDIRPFRILWEHKKIMVDRALRINGIKDTSDVYIDEFKKIEEISYSVFLLVLKYTVTESKAILYETIIRIKEIREKEECLIANYVNFLRNNILI